MSVSAKHKGRRGGEDILKQDVALDEAVAVRRLIAAVKQAVAACGMTPDATDGWSRPMPLLHH